MKKALFLVLLLSGCDQEFRTRKCLEEVRACYCKPPTHFFSNDWDCSQVTNPAYDAAVKACIEANSK